MEKLIGIEQVGNGWITTYTVKGSGQQERLVFSEKDGVKKQISAWLDKEEKEPTP